MGKGETAIDNEIEDVIDKWHLKHWRNQVFSGRVKNGWLNTGTPGLPDRSVMLWDGKTLYIEVKRPGKELSIDQIDFRDHCKKIKAPWMLAESADDVHRYLLNYYKRYKIKNEHI
jgi:hypothetical protein